MPKEILHEIRTITSDLISAGICIDQNFPSIRKLSDGEILIGISNLENLAITLKNIPYEDAYGDLRDNRSYNMKLLDGGLLQLFYKFSGTSLIKHRLAFFPSPDLLEYQNNSDVYEDDELYAEVLARNVVTVPIRFDFDRIGFVESDHPMSHLTIGQYKNCRIPVSAPLTPHVFISFVLRSFYNTPFRNLCSHIRATVPRFERTIVGQELEQVYIHACGAGR